MDVEEPEMITEGGKKKKHNRRKITDENDLNKKSNLDTFKVEILKYYEKSGKLTDLEKMDILPNEKCKLYFAKQNESLANFLNRSETKLGAKSDKKFGLISVSQGAMRCMDFKRELVPDNKKLTKKNVQIAKLFGKHLKLHEQVAWLGKKDKVSVAISTIDRLDKLFEKQAIDINQVDTILLDWNYRNQKFKRLLDQPESLPLISDFLTKLC